MFAHQAGPVVSALVAGLSEHVIMVVPQPGIDTSKWSSGSIAASAAGGKRIVVTGGGAAKEVGQFFSIDRGNVHHLHQITAVSGTTITFQPALKAPVSGGEMVDFRNPKLTGFVSGNSVSWTVGLAENVGLSFQIDEAF